MTKISVIGAGAWGTALAQSYAQNGHDVTLWAREKPLVEIIKRERENLTYLPGYKLDQGISVTSDLAVAAAADVILHVVPAQHVRANLREMKPFLGGDKSLVICSKGIEIETHKFLSEVAREECPQVNIAVFSGPNFAHDIMAGRPSAATLATNDSLHGDRLAKALSSKTLRIYKTTDMIGAQTGGALKNVIAIACGLVDGMGLGESARAALVSRSLAEIARFTVAMGGKRETLMGQCGIGDLMLTCSSMQSRNYSLGYELAKGKTLNQILAERNSIAEGVPTAKAAAEIAREHNIDMPIVTMVCACLHQSLDPREAFAKMMDRPVRSELE